MRRACEFIADAAGTDKKIPSRKRNLENAITLLSLALWQESQ